MLLTKLKDDFDQFFQEAGKDELYWLNGYITGLLEQERRDGTKESPPQFNDVLQTKKKTQIAIIYASQTGNAKQISLALEQRLATIDIDIQLHNCSAIKPSQLEQTDIIWFVVSTHGEGEPPESAIPFFNRLNGKKKPNLKGKGFAVLALGDSSYNNFCATGHQIDKLLEKFGGERLYPIVECDTDYQKQADDWLEDVFTYSQQKHLLTTENKQLDRATKNNSYNQNNTASITLLEKQLLNDPRSDKQTWHYEFEHDLDYRPGDALAILVSNPPEIVTKAHSLIYPFFDDYPELEQTITKIDFSRVNKKQLVSYLDISKNSQLQAKYQKLTDQNTALKNWLANTSLIDLLECYPPISNNVQSFKQWLEQLPKLQPRLYSIASSPLVSKNEIQICVRILERQPTDLHGIATSKLESLQEDDKLQAYIQPQDHFQLPQNSDANLILIGAGTGIAPYRSFLQHRQRQNSSGQHWLFYGDRRMRFDFIYQQEWLQWREDGLLTQLDLAFSRDNANKIYVQHKLLANAKGVWQWLEQGAYIYVCGDATNMAPSVEQALVKIICQQGQMDDEQGQDYLDNLREQQRYKRDIY